MTTVINLFAGPGAGKSSTAADLFAEMKWQGYEVELVNEVAKEIVWEGHHNLFEDQFYISANQNRRLERLVGKVDYIITDSPLLLCEIYTSPSYPREICHLMHAIFNRYDNFNVVINRKKKYNGNGRNQDEAQAREIDDKIRHMLDTSNTTIDMVVDGDREAKFKILEGLNARSR